MPEGPKKVIFTLTFSCHNALATAKNCQFYRGKNEMSAITVFRIVVHQVLKCCFRIRFIDETGAGDTSWFHLGSQMCIQNEYQNDIFEITV